MRLPAKNRDLVRYVRRRYAVRLLLFGGWVALPLLSVYLYNRSHSTPGFPPITGWRLAIWVVIALVSGALLFRIPQMILDRSFSGVIVSSGLSHSYSASPDPGVGKAASYQFRLNTVLRVRDERGKIRRIRFEEKPGFYSYYHEGNYVLHIAGLPYPVADPARSDLTDLKSPDPNDPAALSLCVACGRIQTDAGRCAACGKTLVDPRDLFDRPSE